MKKFINDDISKSLKGIVNELSALKNKKILITGGTGFIGIWLTSMITWLNDEYDFNCKIVLLSRHQNLFKKNHEELGARKDISFISSDIRSINKLDDDINYIIHAASNPDNRIHTTDPINTMDIISNGTKVILDQATRLPNIESILHLSSGQVYGKSFVSGETLSEQRKENFLKNDITSIYSNAKYYSEVICLSYQSQCKLPITIVRPFSFIGPFQELSKPWAINSFIQESMNGQPMRIVGNGKPQRSYLYGSDMAAWLLQLLVNGKRGSIYNVGSSEGISLEEVTKKINTILHNKVDVIIQNYNTDESQFIPNLKFIKEDLGVKETFTFEEALTRTIEWNFKNFEKRNKNESN